MKKLIAALLTAIFTLPSLAVECVGVPESVKMGEYGAQEEYAIVRIAGRDYRLGHHTNEATKIRVSLAQTALVSEKRLKLRFWTSESCQVASQGRATPNSVQLLK